MNGCCCTLCRLLGTGVVEIINGTLVVKPIEANLIPFGKSDNSGILNTSNLLSAFVNNGLLPTPIGDIFAKINFAGTSYENLHIKGSDYAIGQIAPFPAAVAIQRGICSPALDLISNPAAFGEFMQRTILLIGGVPTIISYINSSGHQATIASITSSGHFTNQTDLDNCRILSPTVDQLAGIGYMIGAWSDLAANEPVFAARTNSNGGPNWLGMDRDGYATSKINEYGSHSLKALAALEAVPTLMDGNIGAKTTGFANKTGLWWTDKLAGAFVDTRRLDQINHQWQNYADTGNVGAGEDVLDILYTQAGTFGQNGDTVQFEFTFTFAANANSKRVRIYFFTNLIYDSTAQVQSGGVLIVRGTATRQDSTHTRISIVSTNSATVPLFSVGASYQNLNQNIEGDGSIYATGEGVNNNDIVSVLSMVSQ